MWRQDHHYRYRYVGRRPSCYDSEQMINKGISHAYGGVLSALSIYYTMTPVSGETNKWIEREVVSALYKDRRELLVDNSREVVGDFGRW